MLRLFFLIFGLALCVVVHASDTLRVGNQVLAVNDTEIHVLDLLGTPPVKEPVENEFGAYVGERWQYRVEGRVVIITILHGRVANIALTNN